jgi:hypothetical protein
MHFIIYLLSDVVTSYVAFSVSVHCVGDCWPSSVLMRYAMFVWPADSCHLLAREMLGQV